LTPHPAQSRDFVSFDFIQDREVSFMSFVPWQWRLIAVVCALVFPIAARSQTPRAESNAPALPDGSVIRLGDDRYRHPGPITSSTLTPDGK
jgi:hypothetical protein